ncbi:MDM12 [Candida pseudojiufengensis]|uniref:MDM12 n=1 Tax=Candida pseudojiufengensis TaxID=497109 RepID=UPI00222500E3|nr:MDM12 [Candida pseudojiufengensis]KAI5960818.1 MDM12 [Candida pseudojiufengensis]
MSFDINWETLRSDPQINDSIAGFLQDQFDNLTLPSFISNLQVIDFNLGDIPPEITIRHIGDPFEEFFNENKDETDNNSKDQPSFNKQNEQNDDDYDSDDDDDDDDKLSTIADGLTMMDLTTNTIASNDEQNLQRPPILPSSTTSLGPPTLTRSKDSFQTILGVQGILGSNNQTSGSGTETPSHFLNQQILSSRVIPKIITKDQKQISEKNVNDIQLIVEIKYKGDLHIDLLVTLLVNYPSPNFISLPIKLHITDLFIHSIATIAYLNNSVFFSFLCDINDELETTSNIHTPPAGGGGGGNFVDYYFNDSNNNKERIDILKKIRIESEIGEVENNVLRNVGKVEKFLMEQLRNILRDEIAWPSWICIDLNEEDGE